jgi:hypothetical protein
LELDAEERSLHATLDVGVEAIISAEEILLFKATLEAARYDDATLIYDLCHGFLSLALRLCQETSSSAQLPRRSQCYAYGNSEVVTESPCWLVAVQRRL